jgi:GYF domain 2
MPVQWYYQNREGVVGPVSLAELKYLINLGTITASTLVRNGDKAPWLAAVEIKGLLEPGIDAGIADGSAPESPEWHFNLKGKNKQGPITWRALKEMIAGGQLQPDDLVWKPGMALWLSASQVRGLVGESSPTSEGEPRFRSARGLAVRLRAIWAIVAAMALLGLSSVVVVWNWQGTESKDPANSDRGRTLLVTENSSVNGKELKAPSGPVEQLLDDAFSAVRVEQLDRATRVLDQYLASPLAKQADAAKLLLREIKLATSAADAAAVARNLGDEPLKIYLRQGVGPLVSSIRTTELRPIYERTLLQAFRQENNRRQFIPKGAIAQNPNPAAADQIDEIPQAAPERAAAAEPQDILNPPKLSVLGPDRPARRDPAANPDPQTDNLHPGHRPGPIAADLNDILARPQDFFGSPLTVNGLFKIGTKISEVKGPDKQVVGYSLPVARNDDSTVCTGDGQVEGQSVFLLLDDGLASFLGRVFNKLRVKTTIKPSYKCILTVSARRLLVNGAPTPVVVISSMEVLGGCNYLSVARHQYARAFRTLTVSTDQADVDFGDGDLWVERLGGEEDFVQPIRRKFREMQRRAVTNRDSAMLESLLQRELSKLVKTANAINQILAMEGLRRMRIWP